MAIGDAEIDAGLAMAYLRAGRQIGAEHEARVGRGLAR